MTEEESRLKYVPPINISPEAYGLPLEMDPMAQYVTRKGGGGLGDILRGILNGLYKRGIGGYYIGPNYKDIFRENMGSSPEEYIAHMKTTQRDRTLLVSSKHFSYLKGIYDGDVAFSAASLQELAWPLIKSIDRQHGGRSIVHTHDQYAGIIPAYCNARNMASVHTVHNGFTFFIPYDNFIYSDLTEHKYGIKSLLYDTYMNSGYIDSHATAIKNTDIATFVGRRFYEEILEGRFDNWDIFKNAQATFREIKIKAANGQTRVVMNGIAEEELPENQEYLTKMFGPETEDILGAKNENKLAFQKQMGLKKDKNAILLYWPSRIENSQKGIDSLIGSALEVLHTNKDVQIAIVGDAKGENTKYLGQIYTLMSQAPENSIRHAQFDKKLSNLGYASASAILGASHYEPFGLFWLQGICAGAFGIGAENGGAVDIIREFKDNNGNGFLYKYPDRDGLKYGMNTAIRNIEPLIKNPELYNKVMKENMIKARHDFSQDRMVGEYLQIYDEVGEKHNLFTEGYSHFI
jgi:glycogen synthase